MTGREQRAPSLCRGLKGLVPAIAFSLQASFTQEPHWGLESVLIYDWHSGNSKRLSLNTKSAPFRPTSIDRYNRYAFSAPASAMERRSCVHASPRLCCHFFPMMLWAASLCITTYLQYFGKTGFRFITGTFCLKPLSAGRSQPCTLNFNLKLHEFGCLAMEHTLFSLCIFLRHEIWREVSPTCSVVPRPGVEGVHWGGH